MKTAGYHIILANGYVHVGDDERDTEDLVAGINSDYDDLPKGWCWLAGLYVKTDQVVAIKYVRE